MDAAAAAAATSSAAREELLKELDATSNSWYNAALTATRLAHALQDEIKLATDGGGLGAAPREVLLRQRDVVNEFTDVSTELDVALAHLEDANTRRAVVLHTRPELGVDLGASTAFVDATYAAMAHINSRTPVPVDMRVLTPDAAICQKCRVAPAQLTIVSGSIETTHCTAGVNCLCDCAAADVFPACISCWTTHIVTEMRRSTHALVRTVKDPGSVPPPWRACEVRCMHCQQMTCAFRGCTIVDQPNVFTTPLESSLVTTPLYNADSYELNTDSFMDLFSGLGDDVEPLVAVPPFPHGTFSTILAGVSSLYTEVTQNHEPSLITVEKVVENIRSLALAHPTTDIFVKPFPGSRGVSPLHDDSILPTVAKKIRKSGGRKRHCSICKQTGHNSRGHSKIEAAAKRMVEDGTYITTQ